MAQSLNLVLSLPHGIVTATSLGVKGFAWHRSPGSGRHFRGRVVLVDLLVTGAEPGFDYFDEGGWRDARGDTVAALAAARDGKRTKTALSNTAFNVTPIAAYRDVYLAKTAGELLRLQDAGVAATFAQNPCREHTGPDEVAALAGLPRPSDREARLYLVLCPVEALVLSSLTPAEYAWYATHRPGKLFRQVMFAEVRPDHAHMAADAVYDDAAGELTGNTTKKTKTLVGGDILNHVQFQAWVGHGDGRADSGLFVGDREKLRLWRFPEHLPHAWERAV